MYLPDKQKSEDNLKVCRLHQKISAVAYLFEVKYKGLDEQVLKENWGGRHGVAIKIKRDLGLDNTQRADFDRIFLHVIECARNGKEFDPADIIKHGGRECSIKTDSIQAQIVADALEMGLSTTRAWNLLNEHEIEEGRDTHSISAVTSLVGKLQPKLVHSKKRKQGSTNPEDPWCRARYAKTNSLLKTHIRSGHTQQYILVKLKKNIKENMSTS